MSKISLKVVLLSFVLIFSSCAVEGDDSQIRFVNASPNSSALDFYVDEEVKDAGLVFSQASDYFDIGEGNRRIRAVANLTVSTLIDQNANIEEGTDYTFLALNLRNSIQGVLYRDDNTDPDGGEIKLRFINAAPSTQRVDIYVSFRGTDISDNDRLPTFENVQFSQATRYIDLEDEEYQIRVTTADTKNIILDTGTIDFSNQAVRTIIILDSEGGGRPLTFLTLSDEN